MHSNATRPPRKGSHLVRAAVPAPSPVPLPAPPPRRERPLPPTKERILNDLRLEEMAKAPVLRKHTLANPIVDALARLPAVLADLHVAFSEPLVRSWSYDKAGPREAYFVGVKGILIWDGYTTAGGDGDRGGSFGGIRVYLLAIGEYVVVERAGQWDVGPPELGHWLADFRAASAMEVFHAAGGELAARELFTAVCRRLLEYVADCPRPEEAERVAASAVWASSVAAGDPAPL